MGGGVGDGLRDCAGSRKIHACWSKKNISCWVQGLDA